MENQTAIEQKVRELSDALKAEGLWKPQEPDWVNSYRKGDEICEADFFEWLQFVFLPNKVLGNKTAANDGVAPQAMRFFGSEVNKGKLLQLLVELDSLTC